jgi:hypothetical protein
VIHYHGTPTGGTRIDTVRFLAGRHAMIPFPRPDDLPAAMGACASFCADNGAFSVWKRGGSLDVDGYYQFVDSIRSHPAFDWAVIPDVIAGGERENDEQLARWPFGEHAGVPVWHLHESLARLRRLASAYPRVALGSSGAWSQPGTDPWWGRMRSALESIQLEGGRMPCKLHGLRMLNPAIFTRLPLASADSTNAVRNANLTGRFGMYAPPTLGQRLCVIADRIEAHQSAAVYDGAPAEPELFHLGAV